MPNPDFNADLGEAEQAATGASDFREVMQGGAVESGRELDFGDTEELASSTLSRGTPSRPLLGRLPLARLIPQDVHSVMDYVDAATVMAGALSTHREVKTVSLLLGGSGAVVSALTDYRLSLAKLIPIEAHELIDYAWGASAAAAPFVFGYYKKAPGIAAAQVLAGLGTIAASLFTDYRAYRGVGRRAI